MHHHRTLAGLVLAAALALGACSSDTPAATPTAPAAGSPTATAPAGDAGDTGASAPAAPATGDDLCATIPSLEAINALLDEPVTTAQLLPRTPGDEICDVTGDGVANVQFQVLTPSDRETLIATTAELGYTAVDLNDPALPGALTYAAAVTVFVGDTGYTVQAITLDTISDPNSPAAAQRSATLLAAWLQNLGVAL